MVGPYCPDESTGPPEASGPGIQITSSVDVPIGIGTPSGFDGSGNEDTGTSGTWDGTVVVKDVNNNLAYVSTHNSENGLNVNVINTDEFPSAGGGGSGFENVDISSVGGSPIVDGNFSSLIINSSSDPVIVSSLNTVTDVGISAIGSADIINNSLSGMIVDSDGLTAATLSGTSLNVNVTNSAANAVNIAAPVPLDINLVSNSAGILSVSTVGVIPTASMGVYSNNVAGVQIRNGEGSDVAVSGSVSATVTNFPTTQGVSGTVSIQEPLSIDDNGGSITVDGTVSVDNFPASQTVDGTVSSIQSGDWDVSVINPVGVSGTVTIQEPLSIDDNGGSITVDGTVAATQSGAWNVSVINPVGVSGTVTIQEPLSIDDNGGSITVDGAVTVDDGGGSITVDGTVAATQSGAWNTSLINSVGVSGTVAVTDNGGTLSVDDGGGSLTVDINNWPAQENVNLEALDGTTIAVNAGNANAGTQRVVIASDQTYPTDLSSVSVSANAGSDQSILAAPGSGFHYTIWGINAMSYGGTTTQGWAFTDGNYSALTTGTSNNVFVGIARNQVAPFSISLPRGRELTSNTALLFTMGGTSAYMVVGTVFYTIDAD